VSKGVTVIIGKEEITVAIPKIAEEWMVAIRSERGSQVVWMCQVDLQGSDLRHDPSCGKSNSFKTVIPKFGCIVREFEQMNGGSILQQKANGEVWGRLTVAAMLLHEPKQGLPNALSSY